jgi:hypothetical protein
MHTTLCVKATAARSLEDAHKQSTLNGASHSLDRMAELAVVEDAEDAVVLLTTA